MSDNKLTAEHIAFRHQLLTSMATRLENVPDDEDQRAHAAMELMAGAAMALDAAKHELSGHWTGLCFLVAVRGWEEMEAILDKGVEANVNIGGVAEHASHSNA